MPSLHRTPFRWVALPLAAFALSTLGLEVSPAAALPTQPEDPRALAITLDAVTPAVAQPGESITVTGAVRNVGTDVVMLDSVDVSMANVGLDTVERIEEWSVGAEAISTPITLGTDNTNAELAPGNSLDLSITIDPDQINPGFNFGTLPLRISASNQSGATSGQMRTVLPWYDAQPADEPVQVSWVVPLTVPAEPELLSGDVDTRTQAWLDTLADDGSTRSWVSALSDEDATFLIDPALLLPLAPVGSLDAPAEQLPMPLPTDVITLGPEPSSDARSGDDASASTEGGNSDEAAETLVPGPTLPTPEPPAVEPTPGDGLNALNITELQRAELEFYQELADVGSDRLWFLPTADPDVAALLDLDADADLVDHLLTERRASGSRVGSDIIDAGRHDIAFPQWSQVATEDLADLSAIWPTAQTPSVLVPSEAVANSKDAGVSTVAVDGEPTKLLAYDTAVAGLLSQDMTADTDGDAIQQTLAQTMARYQRSPGAEHSLVITPPRGSEVSGATMTSLSEAFVEAGWVSTVDAESLMVDAPASELTGEPLSPQAPGDVTAYPMPQASPLSAEGIEQIETLRDQSADVAEVLPATSSASRWGPVLDSLYSTRWRQDSSQWMAPLSDVESQVDEVLTGVSITPTTVNFLADEGQIQVTITNDLPVDLQNLNLTLNPGNGRLRILEEPTEPLSIGANSRASVHFRAEAIAGGQVPINAFLSTPRGTVLGSEETISVRVQPTGDWIYWVLGILGGGILILGLARLGRRPKRFDDSDQGDTSAAKALDSPEAPTDQPKDSA